MCLFPQKLYTVLTRLFVHLLQRRSNAPAVATSSGSLALYLYSAAQGNAVSVHGGRSSWSPRRRATSRCCWGVGTMRGWRWCACRACAARSACGGCWRGRAPKRAWKRALCCWCVAVLECLDMSAVAPPSDETRMEKDALLLVRYRA